MYIDIEFPEFSKPERKKSAHERQKAESAQEADVQEKRDLLKLISGDGLEARQALRIMALYGRPPHTETAEAFSEQLKDFGLSSEDLTGIERKQCLAIIGSLTETEDLENPELVHAQLETFLADSFLRKAFSKIDQFDVLMEKGAEDESLRSVLREVMQTVGAIAKIASPSDPNTAGLWKSLSERYINIVMRKKGSSKAQRHIFEQVFSEFQDVIEGDLYEKFVLDAYLKGEHRTYDAEKISMALYGRTEEDVRKKKEENRKAVAEYIAEHKDDEPSVELLQELYRIYNDGIVPKQYASFRKSGQEVLFGTKRVGTLGEDVRAEIEHLITRTKTMLERQPVGVRYGIEAARLHNDLLHIHPFSDRNGSTSMLFLEFLMAKRGYVPQGKKAGAYYDYVRKVVRNNPLAVAVVGAGQYEMVRAFGYFKGETTKGKEGRYQALIKKEYGVSERGL